MPEQSPPVRVAPPVATMPLLRGVARLLSQLALELLVQRRPLVPPLPALPPPLPEAEPPARAPAPPEPPPPPHQPAEAGVARASTAPTPTAAAIERIAYLLICFSLGGLQGPPTDELPVTGHRDRIERRNARAVARESDPAVRAETDPSRRGALAIVLRAVVRHPATSSGAPTGARSAASASRRGIGEGEQRAHRSARRDSEDRDPLHLRLLIPFGTGPTRASCSRIVTDEDRWSHIKISEFLIVLATYCNQMSCESRFFGRGA